MAYGWDDCFLVFSAMTEGDRQAIRDRSSMSPTDEEAEKYIDEYLTGHFVAGRIRVTDDEGKETPIDAQASDVAELPLEMKLEIFSEASVGGAFADPKAFR